MSVKKINISGNEYDIKDANAQAMISDEFDSGTSYTTGDYCIYENVLYKFTSNKSAGAWDSGKVAATNIDTELSWLNSRFVGISKVAGVTSTGERQNTGVTVDIPAGAFFCFTAIAVFNNSSALWVGISENDNVNACHANANSGLNNASCTLSGVNNTDDNISYHIFAQWSGQANNEIRISGFYVRKS